MQQALVVGAGLAGLRAAETLRRRGFDGRVVVVGEEAHMPYSRPPLSKAVLTGAADTASTAFPVDPGLDVDWLLGRRAQALDTRRRRVELEGGEEVPYDLCIVASGCRPRPWPGRPAPGVHCLRTLDDALAIRSAAAAGGRVVIIGAGFLGCEAAAALRTQGNPVTLVDTADRVMPSLRPEITDRVLASHRAHGVDVRLATGVVALHGARHVEGVELSDGSLVEAGVVLVAIGAVPNSEWLRGSGLALDRDGGVLCDELGLAVGTRDVAVAGDVASWPHAGHDRSIRVEHWSNAAEMAIAATTNLLSPDSSRSPYRPVLTFWSDQYDWTIRAVGDPPLGTTHTVVADATGAPDVAVEAHRGDELVGAVTLGRGRGHLRYRRQLAARRDAEPSAPSAPAPIPSTAHDDRQACQI